MKKQPFYFEIKDVMTQFLAAFNDIIISRHTREREVRSRVKVRYVYSPKQRVIHDLSNKARHLTLPVVAVNITGVSRDESRVFNKLEGAYYSGADCYGNADGNTSQTSKSYHVPQPVPVDISVSMSILARYQTDVEQIISNFVPYSDPYIVISWKLPEEFSGDDQEIRTEVLWSGDLSLNYPDQLSGTEPYRLSCDTSFTIKSWLFKEPTAPVNNITKISMTMTPAGPDTDFRVELPVYNDQTEKSYQNTIGPTLTAAPTITHIIDGDKPYFKQEVWGHNFNNITSVYLSGSQINALSGEHVDGFCSGYYPGFDGVPVQFRRLDKNRIEIDMPDVSDMNFSEEYVDIILVNPGGYGTSITSPLHNNGVKLI